MSDSPVEDYLDRLLLSAPGKPREVRGLLTEAEAHRRDATAAGIAEGLSPRAAEQRAVERFGPVRVVATAEARRQSRPLLAPVRQVVSSGLLLGAIGGLAIGVSGLLAGLLAAVKRSTFLSTSRPAPTWRPRTAPAGWPRTTPPTAATRPRCPIGPRRSSASASSPGSWAHWPWPPIVIRRRRFELLPAPVIDTVAVTIFGLAGAWTSASGSTGWRWGPTAPGQWLAAAPPALVLAACSPSVCCEICAGPRLCSPKRGEKGRLARSSLGTPSIERGD